MEQIKIEFNPDQKKVINSCLNFDKNENKNILVSASAGSGKTTVLVERVLKLIDQNNDFSLSDMVIMTFTVKAAADMKKKIKKAIESRLFEDPNNPKLKRASALFSSVDISTIDSFCKKIVDSYYDKIPKDDVEYGSYDPSFRVADDKELAIIYNDVLNDLLEENYADDTYYDFFSSYIEKHDDRTLKEMFLNGIKKLSVIQNPIRFLDDKITNFEKESEKFKVEYVDYELQKYRDLYDKANVVLTLILDKFDNAYNTLKNEDKENTTSGKNLKKVIDTLVPGLMELVEDLKDIEANIESISSFVSRINTLYDISVPAKNHIGLSDDGEYEILKNEFNAIKESLQKIEQYVSILNIEDKYNVNNNEKTFLILLKKYYERVAEAKKKKSIITIGDYAKITLSILYDYDETKKDFVISKNAEIIANKIKTIFVDEYQDTNNIQEKILIALSDNFKDKNVFMVGDIKQCIYCFRNSEPENFAKKFDAYEKDGDSGDNLLIKLNENHRSRKEILDFSNFIFKNIMRESYGKIDYKKDGMLKPSEKTKEIAEIGGREVEACFVYDKNYYEAYNNLVKAKIECKEKEKQDKKDKKIKDLTKPSTEQNKVLECQALLEKYKDIDGLEYEAEYVAQRIEKLVKNEKVDYKQIVILLRNLSGTAEYFIKALAKHGIPSFAELKKGFFNRFEIKLMMSILRIIDNPLQSVDVASVITSNIFGITNSELGLLKAAYQVDHGSYNFDLYSAIIYFLNEENYKNIEKKYGKHGVDIEEMKGKLGKFIEFLNDHTFKARYLSISELINTIYSTINIKDIVYAMPEGRMRLANLDSFYMTAIAYESSSYVGLFNFLRYVEKIIQRDDDQGLAKVIDENDNLVRIMTIHSSKGLEFPIVFLSDTQKAYNTMDERKPLHFSEKYGFAMEHRDAKLRYSFEPPKLSYFKLMQKDKMYQEEMRLLYVAMTRAKNKLIITGFLSNEARVGGYLPAYNIDSLINDTDPKFVRDPLKQKLYGLDDIRKTNNYLDLIVDNFPVNEDYAKIIRVPLTDSDISDKTVNDNENLGKQKTVNKKDVESDFVYPYSELLDVDPKFSVTSIKKKVIENKKEGDKEEDKKSPFIKLNSSQFYEDDNVVEEKKLKNELSDDGLEGSERGTAYHRFMQFYDYEKNEFVCKNEIKDKYIVDKVVDNEKIKKFLATNLGKNMAKAAKEKRLYREQKFMKLFSQDEINEYTKICNVSCKEKNVIIQGIIDAFYVDEDSSGNEYIVLIDYKTDKIASAKINEEMLEKELIDHYRIQLEIYAKILCELTGLPVKEKYIYSFALDREIALNGN